MVAVLPLLFLGGVVVLILLLAPAAIDLVNRDERPSLFWALPFVLWPVPILGACIGPTVERSAFDSATLAAFLWTFTHLWQALFFIALGLGLAASRGLRPGGPTQRRRRTTLIAGVAVFGALLLPMVSVALGWMVFVPMVGLLWLVAMNRRGTRRFELGKAWSASLLVAAAIQAAIAMAHMAFGSMLEPASDLSLPRWSGLPVGVVLAVLVGGLRYLAGAIPPFFPTLSLLTACSLAAPMGFWSTRRPVPRGVVLAQPIDLVGVSSNTLHPVKRPECFWVPGDEPKTHYPCSYYRYILAPPTLPLDRVDQDGWIAVGDGNRAVGRGYNRWEDDIVVREKDGRATIDGRSGSWVLGEDFHSVLSDAYDSDRPLVVVRTPHWTVQDYVSICLSSGAWPDCQLR